MGNARRPSRFRLCTPNLSRTVTRHAVCQIIGIVMAVGGGMVFLFLVNQWKHMHMAIGMIKETARALKVGLSGSSHLQHPQEQHTSTPFVTILLLLMYPAAVPPLRTCRS